MKPRRRDARPTPTPAARRGPCAAALLVGAGLLVVAGPSAWAQAGAETPRAAAASGNTVDVSRLVARYSAELAGVADLPDLAGVLAAAPVSLREGPGGVLLAPAEVEAGLVLPRVDVAAAALVDAGPRVLSAGAVQAVARAVADEVRRRTGAGVYVAPEPRQVLIARGVRDQRPADDRSLTLVVYVSRGFGLSRPAVDAPVPTLPPVRLPPVVSPRAGGEAGADPGAALPGIAPPVGEGAAVPGPGGLPPPPPPQEGALPGVDAGPTVEGPPGTNADGAPETPPDGAPAAPVPQPELLSYPPPGEPRVVFWRDGRGFEVAGLSIEYAVDHPQHPSAESLLDRPVTLTRTADGWVRAAPGWPAETMPIRDLFAGGPVVLRASAVDAIASAVFEAFAERSIIGVFVAPDPEQVALPELPLPQELREREAAGEPIPLRLGGEDFREAGDASLRLRIFTARVARVRSIASGERIDEEKRIDAREHARIRLHSPLQPWPPEITDADGAEQGVGAREEDRRDLLRQDVLDDYALRLSRHPGRRVDVAVAAADSDEPGAAELQYLVRENRPWSLFYQLSNTGPETTDPWRHRFGAVHNQLLGQDDIASLEYVTAGFRESHSIIGSYDRPVFTSESLRLRMTGGWSEFRASDVGLALEQFSGESWFWSAELGWFALQRGSWFVEFFGGVRYQNIQVTNEGLDEGVGEDAIFLPRVGLRVDSVGEKASFDGTVFLEWTENDVAAAGREDLERLGRLDPEREWVTLQWATQASVYLEPLLDPEGWGTGTNWKRSTIAHELAFGFRGQYAFNRRLIPNAEQVIGGLYSVRGYPESAVAGDTTFVGSVEYRFHVPRAFEPYSVSGAQPPRVFGEPFRLAPPSVYGRPDWDLVLKGFLDFGRNYNSQNLSIERDEALLSAGLGVEVQVLRNFSFRTDWGYVLDAIGGEGENAVTVGSQRFHIVLTVLF